MTEILKTINKNVYQRLKTKARMNGITVDAAIQNAIREWIMKGDEESPIFYIRKGRRNNVKLSDMKPFHSKKRNKTLSRDIDKIMYGA